jgi:acetyl-CoA carboxylase/biotin carboxylase 1
LIDIGGKSHVAYLTSKGDVATGMRINVGGANVAFSPDYDPTSLRTDVAGKLVKRLVADGARVKKGEPYGEIEVMKMFMPLKVEEAGVVSWIVNEGAALAPGDILALLDLDNPENVSPATVFSGDLQVLGWGAEFDSSSPKRPHLMLRGAIQKIQGGMAGFVLSDASLSRALHDLELAVTNPTLPIHEVDEQLSVLSGRIPAGLLDQLTAILKEFRLECESAAGSGIQLR